LQLDELKAEVLPVAEIKTEEKEVNPLEPFLVSKSVEPVAENKFEPEAKVETPVWTNVGSIELEVVNTSEEILEPVNNISEINSEASELVNDSVEEVEEIIEEPVLVVKPVVAEIDPIEAAKKAEQEEIQRRANERIQKLREISLKLKSPGVLNEMENEPAYKRRNVSLDNVPHSSESQVSRFTLTETDEKKIEIRPNNSFLHDNVD
jgi:cell division protein FtsZ